MVVRTVGSAGDDKEHLLHRRWQRDDAGPGMLLPVDRLVLQENEEATDPRAVAEGRGTKAYVVDRVRTCSGPPE